MPTGVTGEPETCNFDRSVVSGTTRGGSITTRRVNDLYVADPYRRTVDVLNQVDDLNRNESESPLRCRVR